MSKNAGQFILYIVVSSLLFANSCKTRKQATPSPTGEAVMLKDRSVDDLLSKLDSSAFQSEWMSAKASVTTKSESKENSFTIHMRARKDSVIWLSITPLLGIEAARVIITQDSIKVIDRINSKYRTGSMEYINKLLQMKVNFEIVQALLTGNFFAYKKNENKFNSVYLEDKYYILSSLTKHKLKRSLEEKDPNKSVIQDCYIDTNFRITSVSVDDLKINKTLTTDYSDFRLTDGRLFPFVSKTKITAEKNFEIHIEYSKVETGEVQEFPFNIPNSYERVR